MKYIKKILLLLIIVLLLVAGILTYGGYQKYKQALMNMPVDELVAEIRAGNNYTRYEDIPQFYFDAVVAVEDRRFYDHEGFDVIGIGRAIVNDMRAGKLKEGGSTISQQLAKNLYFPEDNTLERKIAEIFMADKIEEEYSKKEILELYANVIYFGSGYYNIYDAANGYYGKTPAELDEYELSMLAGVPNAPSVYSPKVNPDLASERQRQVLQCMQKCGYIKKTDIERIMNMNE